MLALWDITNIFLLHSLLYKTNEKGERTHTWGDPVDENKNTEQNAIDFHTL